MPHEPADSRRVLELLADAPARIAAATAGVPSQRLSERSEAEPWSPDDILAHLRACADTWGASIVAMLAEDRPTIRYVSPRALMRRPAYRERPFDAALADFAAQRRQLVTVLEELDADGWARPGIFTGTSARERDQTVLSYAARLAGHEQAHLDQLEALLR
jgi:hypothetical protein